MKSSTRIAILGAGIMGCSLALYLARRGVPVTLVEGRDTVFSAASRWNEGKIHLGYLYSADPSLRSAEHMMEGGLWFRPLVEDLLACDLGPVITAGDDIYLCHRDSVVAPAAMHDYLERVAERVRALPGAAHYLADVSRAPVRRLSATQLDDLRGSPAIVAGFQVPERSVQTQWIADRFAAAVEAAPGIELSLNYRVTAVEPAHGSDQGPWYVTSGPERLGPFSHVINALWEGRLAVDQSVGVAPVPPWSHRYRLALFLRTARELTVPCTVVATGPFGDVKNYNGRDFYLSWYPAGLMAEGNAVDPPTLDAAALADRGRLIDAVFDNLGALLPAVATLRDTAEAIDIGGGWVFAAGQGKLSDPSATLHERWRYGVQRRGTYLSIDTGKYSTAPWTARKVAAALA